MLHLTPTAVKKSKAGLGLFAKDLFKKGDIVIEYIGPFLTNKEADEKGGMYLFKVTERKTIDGSQRSNTARYINHSCRPNCEPEIRRGRVYIIAKRTIHPEEEITYNYGREHFNYFIKPRGCECAHCRAKKASLLNQGIDI